MRSEFVHTVSHDLRSPLTSVIGYTELVERAGSLNDLQKDFLNRIQDSVQQITCSDQRSAGYRQYRSRF